MSYSRTRYECMGLSKLAILNDRTGVCCKMLRRFLNRGERLIKFGDSWFSTKFIVVRRISLKLGSKVTREFIMQSTDPSFRGEHLTKLRMLSIL